MLLQYLVRNLNLNIVEESLIREIRSFVGTKNIFIGISGGIDSALVAFLSVKALGRKRVFGLLMPYGRQKDINDALAVVGQLGIKYFSKDIKPIVDQYKIRFSTLLFIDQKGNITDLSDKAFETSIDNPLKYKEIIQNEVYRILNE